MAEPSHNPYPRSPNPSTRSYDSSSVSSATSPRPPSRYLGGMLNTTSRPNPASQSLGIPTLPPVNQGFPPYAPMPPTSMMGRESVGSTESLVGSQAGNPAGQGQKRAYRQRRKDPSCDACRERKVKCDATETTSCSECSSRNVKCQFTKETNRRMSSIKQVQDLEKQIERVKRDNSNLRRMLQDRDASSMDVDSGSMVSMGSVGSRESSFHLPPPIESDTRQRKRLQPLQDLARARSNLLSYSKGIWKPPARNRTSQLSIFEPQMPDLPPRQVADQLLNTYYTTLHTMFPILHLPTFRASVDDIYRTNPPRAPPPFLAVFFTVLAIGCLFTPDPPTSATFYRPAEFLDLTRSVMDPWSNSYTLDDARASILIAICLNEMNLKSAAWRWLGNAVRIGQDLSLYMESSERWPIVEGEMRRRTWWAIYILDRVLATEMGHPFLIQDAHCSVALPAAVDDQYVHDDGMRVPSGAEPLTHSLLAVIHVVRSYTALDKAMEIPVVAAAQLAAFDGHFKKCLSTFPPACDPASAVALAPHFLAPLTYLFHARLLLHRHNLSPSCDVDTRLAALESCTHIAVETASLIGRTPSPSEGATALFTAHAFRCTLFLLLTGCWDQALTCIRALADIDARRDVATACGRYLSFFAATLASKRAEHANRLARTASPLAYGAASTPPADQGSSVLVSLARDEELLAYVSADLHASPSRSWVWGDDDPPKPEHHHPPTPSSSGSLFSVDMRTGLSDDERRDWGGWGRLDAAVRSLRNHPAPTTGLMPPQQSQWSPLPQVKSESPAGPSMQRIPEAPRYVPEEKHADRTRAAARDRLSIANII